MGAPGRKGGKKKRREGQERRGERRLDSPSKSGAKHISLPVVISLEIFYVTKAIIME